MIGSAQFDTHPIHSLSGIKVCAGAKGLDASDFITEQQVGGAAGNMKQQHFLAEQFVPLRSKKRGGRMALLVRRMDERDAPGQRKGRGRVDACQEAGHITSLHRTRFLGDAHRCDLGQIKLMTKLFQHFRECYRVVEQRITLAQPKLALLDREKPLLCANNLSGCIKNGQRGCIVACVDSKCVTAHSSSDSIASAASSPFSRATAPSRPLTNW